uniref:Uncharacterized protein n=1 Tax=Arundo donax TaxID=35708 RepID=A0A0A9CMZ4_ARUDO
MATAAGSKRGGGRGRKPLVAVLDNEANISAGKAAVAAAAGVGSSAQKAKRPLAKSKAKAAAAAPADEMAELQGMLERLRLEKEQAEEMVRERDEVIRRKEEEQERLQAELRKVQRAKEFKPTVNLPLVKSFLEKQQDGDDKGKKKGKGKGKAGPERKRPCPAYALWLKDQWNECCFRSRRRTRMPTSRRCPTRWARSGRRWAPRRSSRTRSGTGRRRRRTCRWSGRRGGRPRR